MWFPRNYIVTDLVFNEHCLEIDYEDLLLEICAVKCPKCFCTHWKKVPSGLDVFYFNIVAKKTIKLIEEFILLKNKHIAASFFYSNVSDALLKNV